jgi:hypothetical protein
MDSTSIILKQNIILRQVDPIETFRKLMLGTLIVPMEKVPVDVKEIRSDIKVGPDSTAEVYEITDKDNRKLRIFTLNHKAYSEMLKYYLTTGTYSESCLKGLGLICDWCKKTFNDIPWQIPIKYECGSLEAYHVFHGEGTYCTLQCMYADYKLRYAPSKSCPDYHQRDVYCLIKLLISLRGIRDEELVSAPHWKLLCHNGGLLSEEDFYGSRLTYAELPQVITLPTKRQYSIYK